jgi:hypothetical protein
MSEGVKVADFVGFGVMQDILLPDEIELLVQADHRPNFVLNVISEIIKKADIPITEVCCPFKVLLVLRYCVVAVIVTVVVAGVSFICVESWGGRHTLVKVCRCCCSDQGPVRQCRLTFRAAGHLIKTVILRWSQGIKD